MSKIKIILDADVVIHFAKGGYLNVLPLIFKEYEYAILDIVYNEILKPTRIQLDNQIHLLSNITRLPFKPQGEMLKEYAMLTAILGKGESACMVYCKYNNDVIGSSNLRDIREYCQENKLIYLTTIDFLYYAIKNKVMTIEEATQFILDVNNKDSRLPNIDFRTYISDVVI